MYNLIYKIESEKSPLKTDAECYILAAGLSENFIKDFKAKAGGKIFLSEDIETCLKLNLDGVLIDLSKSEQIKKEIAQIRVQIGSKVLGIISRSRRHEAMIVSEQEPDFVAFRLFKDGRENVEELVSWYNDLFLIQSAVIIEDDGIDYSNLKTDNIIVKA